MIRFTAYIEHTYETILRMCRAMDDTFFFKRKILLVLAGAALTVLGAWNMENVAGILMLMIGCWLLASLNLPAKNQADNIKKALGGQYPRNKYEFQDKHFVLYAQNQDIISYDKIKRLVEDDGYCYLCLNEQASYMLEKASLGGDLEKFKTFMTKATGLAWKKPYRLATFNIRSMMELFGGKDQQKKKNK
ncbi:MAG: YcxB family protein [Clostridia bacterium]|nr:YcxB family protein [Clostridia bacterium]